MRKKYYNSLHKSIRYGFLFILFIILLSLTLSSVYALISLNVNHAAEEELHEQGRSLIQKFDALLENSESTLDELNKLPNGSCSREEINALKLLRFSHYFIQNATLLEGDDKICSSMQRENKDLLMGVPSSLVLGDITYWFNQTIDIQRPYDYYVVMQKEHSRVNLHLDIIINSLPENKPYLVAQILFEHQVIAGVGLMDTTPLPLLHAEQKWVSKQATSKNGPFSVVIARNKNHIDSIIRATFKRFFWGSSLFALFLFFIMCVLMKKHHSSFKSALIEGLEERQFIPYFQPIMNAKNNTCVGAEVLTRWVGRDGGIISPSLFIPAAEEYGLISRLTRYIIIESFKEVGDFLSKSPQYYISINLSLEDISDEGIYNLLVERVTHYELEPQQLRIELTERQFIDKERSIAALNKYRSAGYKIYVDDFGTGYSSLAYLKDLPLDTLKIDKVFVDSIGQQCATSSVTKHIIEMANTLQLELVAEGVESEEQSQQLQALGVNIMQGWLFSKALPAKEWMDFCQLESKARQS